ncbi:glycosyltransferase [Candidatus Nomurabacteria bacterium]|uniref:Glycosyltransferase n=1 Tax=candidate division WWE3 bacterium TaxID=2053526 RepID=A0A955DZL4_UNCKA|nr:glycosyltransferase [candidate division WWE3 bacterium]MCB9823576.1 glycosyltransferase [Candidatus Nomurabacteria bacterium]MCB9827371.1 glycosyltransferase [Candidatus Nomurabacteria bacterium]HXK52675.1 glycosyltransferase [bacterium]
MQIGQKDEKFSNVEGTPSQKTQAAKAPKIAFVHEYLVQYGGAQKTLEAMLEVFPNSPIYTGLYDKKSMSSFLNNQTIHSTQNKLLSKFQKYLTFLMPLVFEGMDLQDFDIIISDGTAWPKGVLTNTHQLHISYIHTPPRFLYGYSVESQKRDKWYFKPILKVVDNILRVWDYNAAQRPDFLLTNSFETLARIKKFYGREAKVIYPPVELSYNNPETSSEEKIIAEEQEQNTSKNYYIMLGRLSAYKNFDVVIKAFNKNGKNLVILGTGYEENYLRSIAKTNITFIGRATDKQKSYYLENCKGLINAVQDEDFGIVPIEAMAYGKPVLAHRSGGHLETIVEGLSGMFFESLEVGDLIKSIESFDKSIEEGLFDAGSIKKSVQKFDKEIFKKDLKDFVLSKWEEKLNAGATRSSHHSSRNQ